MNTPRVPRQPLTAGARAFVALFVCALVSVALLVIVGALAGVVVLLHWIFSLIPI